MRYSTRSRVHTGGLLVIFILATAGAGTAQSNFADVSRIAMKAAALPPATSGAKALYDDGESRRTNTYAALVPRERWDRIGAALEGMQAPDADGRELLGSLSIGYYRSPQFSPALVGSVFTQVPEGHKLVLYERIEAPRGGARSVRVLTPNAARVFLNGKEVWKQETADLLEKSDAINLRLQNGVNQLAIEIDPTPGVSFLTTGVAQRVGGFLAPILAENPAAFAWFESWLENPTELTRGDPLDACLRSVGSDVLADLRKLGGTSEEVLKQGGQRLTAGSSLGEKARIVIEAAAHRRALRLDALKKKVPGIVYAAHRDYRPSFFGYTEGLSDARAERHFHPGTSLGMLDFSKGEPVAKDLLNDAHGMIRDPDVSYDGKHVLFAWKKSDRNDDFQLHELELDSGRVRQVTYGLGVANYEGAYLPDGTIVFSSTRDEHSVPCWLTEVSNLYKMNRDGTFLRRLAIDQVHSIYPKPTDDGRITYTRWDYSDRGQVYPHPLFQMNQDGTMQGELYGASSWFPTSLLHARQIPGTQKFIAIAAGHHTPQAGKVVEVDTSAGRDEGEGVSLIAPREEPKYERVDAAMQDGSQFAHPFPLDAETFLAAHLPVGRPIRRFDLYWFDHDGGRELLLQQKGIESALYPVALGKRPEGHVRPERVNYAQGDSVIFIEDVYKGGGLAGIPRGTADRLRVVEVRYRAATVGSTGNEGEGGGAMNGSPIALAQGAWDVKAIIGETPIHPDGSVMVKVPAMKSIYYQVLDRQGQVIQTMRTWDTNRPGEIKSCVGCHSYNRNDAPTSPNRLSMASRQPPAELEPFEPTRWEGFSFASHVQPILNRSCLDCHNGADRERIDLRGDVLDTDRVAKRHWSRAYTQLTNAKNRGDGSFSGNPDGPWVKWINKMSVPTTLPPYAAGAAKSPLVEMLRKGHHGVKLTDAEFRTLSAWIDLLVPFSGDYREGADWDEGQHDYYTYYENKRRVSKLEQHDEVRRYLEGVNRQEWFAGDIPALEIALERNGSKVFEQRFEPAVLGDGAVAKLPGPLHEGDRLTVRGARSLRVGLAALPDAEIHAPNEEFEWKVEPGLPAVLPPELFTDSTLELRVKPLRPEERGGYRNLACNPFAPSDGDTVFPHVTASSAARNDPMFRARTAIDGIEENTGGHSAYPHQAWGPEKEDRPWMTVKFGRKVRIDRVDLLLRADFPHDETWRRAVVIADGREVATVSLRKTADAQTVTFDPVECETLELRELEWTAPGWCALSEIRVWGLDADRTPTALIAQHAEEGRLKDVELQ